MPITELERIYVSPGPIFDPHKMGCGFNPFDELFGKEDIVINTWSYHLVPAGILLDQFLREAAAKRVSGEYIKRFPPGKFAENVGQAVRQDFPDADIY